MNNSGKELDALLLRCKALRSERDALEASIELTRRQSRELAIQLMFDWGYSVNATAAVTGHQRPTLKVWIESELAKRPELVKPAHLRP